MARIIAFPATAFNRRPENPSEESARHSRARHSPGHCPGPTEQIEVSVYSEVAAAPAAYVQRLVILHISLSFETHLRPFFSDSRT